MGVIKEKDFILFFMHDFEIDPPAMRKVSEVTLFLSPNPYKIAIKPFLPTTILTSPISPLIIFPDKALDKPRPSILFTPCNCLDNLRSL